MKNIIFYIIWFISSISYVSADWGILWDFDWKNTASSLREWNIDTDDIPNIIRWLIDFWLSIAGTISVIFIIVWAYKILFWSIEQETSKWKNTIIMAITWFIIASLAWFIIKFMIDNLN